MAQSIKIVSTADKKLLATIKKIATTINTGGATISTISGNTRQNINFSEKIPAHFTPTSKLIYTLSLAAPGYSITYYRGGNTEPKSPYFDEISISSTQDSSLNEEQKLTVGTIICTDLFVKIPEKIGHNEFSSTATLAAEIHSETLSRLENTATQLLEKIAQKNFDLEEKYEIRAAELNAQYERETAAKKTELSLYEEQLSLREKNLDDSDNTFARRQIRDKMLDDVKIRINDFGVSINTSKQRIPVYLGFILAISTLIIVAIFYTTQYNSLITENLIDNLVLHATTKIIPTATIKTPNTEFAAYAALIKSTLATIGAIGMILYFIKWQDKWAEKHAESEFALQQFYIDVNRANWIVETGLEWHKETNEQLPEKLMDSLSANLFNTKKDHGEKSLHPADELASALLGSASKLQLKAGDNILEFNKPGKIPKQVDSKAEEKD